MRLLRKIRPQYSRQPRIFELRIDHKQFETEFESSPTQRLRDNRFHKYFALSVRKICRRRTQQRFGFRAGNRIENSRVQSRSPTRKFSQLRNQVLFACLGMKQERANLLGWHFVALAVEGSEKFGIGLVPPSKPVRPPRCE